MKRKLLLFLTLLLSFWSCEKGDNEDIVVIPDPPVVYVSVQNNGVLPYNSSTIITYHVDGELDSMRINIIVNGVIIKTVKVTTPDGDCSTGRLEGDAEANFDASNSGGKDSVTVLIPVAEPVPSLEVTISSRNIEWGETVSFTWRYSYLTKCTLNGVEISSSGSKNIVLKNDSTFVFVGIPINGDTIRQTYVVKVGAKPNWKTFLEIGLDVVWKEYQVYYMPEGSTEWKLSNANDGFQVIFNPNGTTTESWNAGSGQASWSLSDNILKYYGNAQILEISETQMILYYEKRPRIINGEHIEIPHKFIYKRN